MRLKVSMIIDLGNCHEETVIDNNESKQKGMCRQAILSQRYYKPIDL